MTNQGKAAQHQNQKKSSSGTSARGEKDLGKQGYKASGSQDSKKTNEKDKKGW